MGKKKNMKASFRITDVFPITNKEVLEEHTLIKERVKKLGVNKPRVLISIDSGIAYVFEMQKSKIMSGPSYA